MSDQRVLVVGAGQAAVQFAVSLREGGFTAPITLVGRHRHLPYQRPPLSKAFLTGAADADSIALRAAQYYAEQQIDLLLGESVVDVTVDDSGAGSARTDCGTHLEFGRLVLATGAGARRLDVPGADARGVHTLTDLDDAQSLLAALSSVDHLVVIGGGFIGLEVAATARGLGRTVTVLEAAPALLGRAVGPQTAEHVLAAHREAGVTVVLRASVVALKTDGGRVTGVELADGSTIDAQAVLIGVGAVPRTDLAERLGLECADGILVDEYSLASDGLTLAIGDCCALPDPTPGIAAGGRLRLESVDNAVEQAKAAATVLTGRPRPYRSVPWFWSDQGSLKLQIAGLWQAGDDVVVRRHRAPGKWTAGYYRSGCLVAAEAINAPADFMNLRKALAAGVQVEPRELSDPDVALKSVVASRL